MGENERVAVAWDAWLASDDGQAATQPDILRDDAQQHYLLNRLWYAFMAGARAGEGASTADAVALGKRGGMKGGKARAAKLSPERRSEIARIAANKRWGRHG